MILATPIRRDEEGRYCLNDLHRAAGGEERHKPRFWLANAGTNELIAELKGGNPPFEPVALSKGRYGGTYAIDDLALTYAMWVSPKLYLTVVRAFKEPRQAREAVAEVSNSGNPLVAPVENRAAS